MCASIVGMERKSLHKRTYTHMQTPFPSPYVPTYAPQITCASMAKTEHTRVCVVGGATHTHLSDKEERWKCGKQSAKKERAKGRGKK